MHQEEGWSAIAAHRSDRARAPRPAMSVRNVADNETMR